MTLQGIVAMLTIAWTAQLPKGVPATEALQYVGQVQTVCGPVAGVRHEGSGDRALVLLDLVGASPDQALTIAVTKKPASRLAGDFAKRAPSLDVCATGKIQGAAAPIVTVDSVKNLRGVSRIAQKAQEQHGEGITLPRVRREAKVKYTPAALEAQVEGSVEIEVRIGVDGSPSDARVLKSLDALFGLDDEAVRSALQWQFEPARRQGTPISYLVIIQLEFRLSSIRVVE